MADKTLSVMLRFAVAQGNREVTQSLAQMQTRFRDLEAQAKAAQEAIELRKRIGADYTDLTRRVESAKGEMARLAAEAKKTQDTLVRAAAETKNKWGETATRIGGAIAGISGAALAGGQGLMQAYLNTAQEGDAVAKKWESTWGRIEESQARVGRVMVERFTPALEKLAAVAESAAAFIEKNPQAVELIGGLASGGAVLGGALIGLGQIAQTLAALKMLGVMGGSGGGLLSGAGAALSSAGAATGAAAPIVVPLAGAAAGFSLYNPVASAANQYLGANLNTDAAGQALSLMAGGAGSLFGQGNEWFLAMAKLTGVIEANTQATDNNTGAQNSGKGGKASTSTTRDATNEQKATALEWFITYQKNEDDALARYTRQRQQTIDAFNADQRDRQAKFDDQIQADRTEFNERQRDDKKKFDDDALRAAADFQRQEAEAVTDYYATRVKAAAQYDQETLRAEEDHRKRMVRMAEDAGDRLQSLAESRDALGMVRELRAQEKERQRQEEDYATEAEQRNADYAERLRDEEKQFAEERQRRLDDFSRRQAEARAQFTTQQQDDSARFAQRQAKERAQFTAEQTLRATQHQTRLTDMQTQFNDEKVRRKLDFTARLTELNAALTGEQEKRRKFYADSAKDFDAWLEALRTGKPYVPPTTSSGGGGGPRVEARASGGYAGYGLYRLGERGNEFVLSADTTRAAEVAAGNRRLTQGGLLAALRGGGMSVVINNQLPAGTLSASDRRALAGLGADAALSTLSDALRALTPA